MLPPRDIPASELFLKLKESPRPSEIVDFPRKEPDTGEPIGRMRIQVLDMPQHDEARIRAHKWLKEKKGILKEDLESPLLQEVFGDRVAREVLAMACLSVEPIKGTAESGAPRYARIFRSTEDLEGANLTADELTVLFSMYEMIQHRYGPLESSVATEEEVNAWIDRLSEGASSYPLAGQSWHQLAALCSSLTDRISTLSGHLVSLRSSWPESLGVSLEILGIGIGSSGEHAVSNTRTGLGTSQGDIPNIPEEPITVEQAADIAKRVFGE